MTKRKENFILRYRRLIIAIWIIVALISLTQLNLFFSNVSYNITNVNLSQTKNAMSTKAYMLLKQEFPSMNKSGDVLLIVIQSNNIYKKDIKIWLLNLNNTLAEDKNIENFSGI
ncbi:MAG: hypothetical protein RXR31_04850, partial [Thermoproteota archaeon]